MPSEKTPTSLNDLTKNIRDLVDNRMSAFSQGILQGDGSLSELIKTANNPRNFPHLSNKDSALINEIDDPAIIGHQAALKVKMQKLVIQNKKRFKREFKILLNVDAFWQYLEDKALLELHYRSVKNEIISLNKQVNALITSSSELQSHEHKREKELHIKKIAAIQNKINEYNTDLKTLKKEFVTTEDKFLTELRKPKEKRASLNEIKFSLSDNTKKLLGENDLTNKSIISDTKNKISSLRKNWEKQNKYADYTAKELLVLKHDYLDNVQNWLNDASNAIRQATEPKGFFEKLNYYSKKIVDFVIPADRITKQDYKKKKDALEKYQEAHDYEELQVIENMLAKLETAEDMRNLQFDDHLWWLNKKLGKLNCNYFHVNSLNYNDPTIIRNNGQEEILEDDRLSYQGKKLTFDPSTELTAEIALKFYTSITQFIEQNSIKKSNRENNSSDALLNKKLHSKATPALEIKDRFSKLKMFQRHDDWKKIKIDNDITKSLDNNPAIWLAINSLDGKITPNFAESFQVLGTDANLFDTIDQEGNLFWLKNK